MTNDNDEFWMELYGKHKDNDEKDGHTEELKEKDLQIWKMTGTKLNSGTLKPMDGLTQNSQVCECRRDEDDIWDAHS